MAAGIPTKQQEVRTVANTQGRLTSVSANEMYADKTQTLTASARIHAEASGNETHAEVVVKADGSGWVQVKVGRAIVHEFHFDPDGREDARG